MIKLLIIPILGDALRYAIRLMQLEDIAQANEIDRECFPEWPPASYKREILFSKLSLYLVACERENKNPLADQAAEPKENQRTASRLGQFWHKLRLFFSSEESLSSATNQRIVGLSGLWIMSDDAHLTTIGIREPYRRQGIGELLLIAALELALTRNARVVTLEVRSSNLVAQRLYEKYGFSRMGLRRGYYTDNGEDAVIMSTDTLTSASFQSHLQRLKQAHAQRWGKADCQIGQYPRPQG